MVAGEQAMGTGALQPSVPKPITLLERIQTLEARVNQTEERIQALENGARNYENRLCQVEHQLGLDTPQPA